MSSFRLLLFFALISACAAQAQNVRVNNIGNEPTEIFCLYKLNYQPDSTANFRSTELMRLSIGSSTSQFQSQGTYLSDSLAAAMPDTPGSNFDAQQYATKLMGFPNSRMRLRVYKKPASNKIYCYEEVSGVMYKYEESLPLYKWKVMPDKAVIAGYTCQKATTDFSGRTFEAWFTREVPVGEGPYKFYGLPGLIVKISDTRNQYIFELIKLSDTRNTNPITLPHKTAFATNKAALYRAKENYKANLPNIIAATSTQKSESSKLDVRARIKRMNNALELR